MFTKQCYCDLVDAVRDYWANDAALIALMKSTEWHADERIGSRNETYGLIKTFSVDQAGTNELAARFDLPVRIEIECLDRKLKAEAIACAIYKLFDSDLCGIGIGKLTIGSVVVQLPMPQKTNYGYRINAQATLGVSRPAN